LVTLIYYRVAFQLPATPTDCSDSFNKNFTLFYEKNQGGLKSITSAHRYAAPALLYLLHPCVKRLLWVQKEATLHSQMSKTSSKVDLKKSVGFDISELP